jgi:hypothetical protein
MVQQKSVINYGCPVLKLCSFLWYLNHGIKKVKSPIRVMNMKIVVSFSLTSLGLHWLWSSDTPNPHDAQLRLMTAFDCPIVQMASLEWPTLLRIDVFICKSLSPALAALNQSPFYPCHWLGQKIFIYSTEERIKMCFPTQTSQEYT